jgi:CelD/BcsL family acetyltransferase involved in cellulose biosynthesis
MTGSHHLELAVVRDLEGLQALGPEWDALVLAAARPSPFLLHAWVTAWWRHFGAGAELAVIIARSGPVLVGIAPMYIRRRWGLRVCRLLGGHESALGDLLVAPDEGVAVGQALLDRLAEERLDYLDVFGPPEGGVLPRLASHDTLRAVRRVDAPVLRMPEGWEPAYTSRVNPKKRNLHRRRLRQLAEVGEVGWTMARAPGDVARELEHAFEIHSRRWKGRPDGSTFGVPNGQRFHRDAAAALSAQDAVRILTLRIDGRPVAFHYWFVLGSTMYVHRLAFDPDLARLSPGQVTLLHALAAASAEGVRRVEFLGGDERYKLELADALEPLNQVVGLPSGPVASLAVQAILFGITSRMRLKQNEWLHHVYLQGVAPLRRALGRFSRQPAK